MAIERKAGAGRHLRVLFESGVAAGLSDRERIERFRGESGEVSELAFAALVERHGPMVLQVCRATLGDEHEAHDAFQATFLVLVHKARRLWVRDSIGPWLHAVAVRIAAGARASSASRRSRERRGAVVDSPVILPTPLEVDELRAALHEEIERLPEGYRKAVVLCDLEGLTHSEAARRLGWPVGTVKSRQGRGRDRLRSRLIRRGLAPASGAFASMIATSGVKAAVPAAMVDATARVASMVAAGQASAAAASAAAMAAAIVRAMIVARLRLALGVMMALGTSLATAGLAIQSGAEPPRVAPPVQKDEPPPRRLALDLLKRDDIPPEKRLADLPPPTVAVLGEVRGRNAGEVRGLAITPDGKTLASIADQDHMVRLWDASTLLKTSALAGHRGFGRCVSISPDGQWLVSGGEYGDFFLWDLNVSPPKGPLLLPTRRKDLRFFNRIDAAAISPDGKTLAVAGDAGGFELFDMTTSPPTSRRVLGGIPQQARSLAFAPDSKTIAMAGLDDGTVRLFEIDRKSPREKAALKPPDVTIIEVNGKKTTRVNPVVSVAFAADGSMLGLNQHGDVWRARLSGPKPQFGAIVAFPIEKRRPSLRGLPYGAALALSNDRKTLAAAQPDGGVHLWDGEGGNFTEWAAIPPDAAGDPIGALAFAPDGKTLYIGGGDHLIRAWDLSNPVVREKSPPQGPTGGISGLAFSPDGTRLAVADLEAIRIWDLTDIRDLSRIPSPTIRIDRGSRYNLPIVFRPDGRSLFAGGERIVIGRHETRHFRIWPPIGGADFWSLALSADGRTLVSGGNDNKVRLWDASEAEPIERLAIIGDRSWRPPVVAISPDGQTMAFAGSDQSVQIWSAAPPEPHSIASIAGNGWPISSLAFSPNGKILAAGTNSGTRVWDITDAVPRLLSAGKPIERSYGFSMAFTPDGKRIVAADQIADWSGKKASWPAVCVYDVATGARLHGWEMTVPSWAIAMAPDGRHVAVARRDGLTLILRLPDDH